MTSVATFSFSSPSDQLIQTFLLDSVLLLLTCTCCPGIWNGNIMVPCFNYLMSSHWLVIRVFTRCSVYKKTTATTTKNKTLRILNVPTKPLEGTFKHTNFLDHIPINGTHVCIQKKQVQKKKLVIPLFSSQLFSHIFLTQLNSPEEYQATCPGIILMLGSIALISSDVVSEWSFTFTFEGHSDFWTSVTYIQPDWKTMSRKRLGSLL